jgi:hypothetical protein
MVIFTFMFGRGTELVLYVPKRILGLCCKSERGPLAIEKKINNNRNKISCK